MGIDTASSRALRFLRKRDLLRAENPAHEHIRTLLMISGGGMRGVYGAGVCIALHHLELSDCFDTVIGVSTGAAIGGYFLTGKAYAACGTTIYYEECLGGFIKRTIPIPTVDIDFLESVFRNGAKKLDLTALAESRSKFLVGVTHYDTGSGELVDAKCAQPDPIAAIKASLALTFAYRNAVYVNETPYTDGGMSEPLPLEEAVRQCTPTDILVVSNYSEEESRAMGESWKEKVLDMVLSRRMPSQLKTPFATRDTRWKESLAYAENPPCMTKIFYGPRGVHILTRNLLLLRTATLQGITDALAFFGDETPPVTLMP